MHIETLTAETPRGRKAIEQVMAHSYQADVDDVPPAWALARVVNGTPVSFILIDPHRQMDFPAADLRYAFICDVATREDQRHEGHFRAIMEIAFTRLLDAGIHVVATHGRYPLYRRFGFDVFTHQSGIFVTPGQIARTFGAEVPDDGEQWLAIGEGGYYKDDLLVITDVTATTLAECKAALLAAASIARMRGKQHILIEHPAAPSYGSRYPLHPTLDTPLIELTRACGAEIRIQGADPESGSIPDADWIKVLDIAGFLRAAIACQDQKRPALTGRIGVVTDAGRATLDISHKGVVITEWVESGVPTVTWPSAAIAQLVTGYRTASVLDIIHNTALPKDIIALLGALFPPGWRFSRNESWTYKA